jgi:hypothetical protein
MADLADILAGAGPLGPAELQAQIYGTQAADPRVLASSSGPVGQAIGQLTATLGAAPQAMAAAQQLAGQQTAAMPDIGKYLSAEDPVRAAAADASGDPAARWAMLRSSPEQVAQMRELQSRAALQRAQTILPTAKGGMIASGGGGIPTLPGATGGTSRLVPGVGAAAPSMPAPPDPAPGLVLPPGKARMDWLQHTPGGAAAILALAKRQQTGGGG